MTSTDPQNVIESYLRQVRYRISPPGAVEHADDVLDELRDHLLCDAEQLVANGVEPRSAAQRAVLNLGMADELARGLLSELVRPHLRRLTTTLLLLGLGAGAVWTAVLAVGPDEPWTERNEPSPVVFFEAAGQWAATLTLFVAVLGVLFVSASRRIRVGVTLRAVLQRGALCACWLSLLLGAATAAQLAGYLSVRAVLAPGSLAWPELAVAGVLTLVAVPVLAKPLRAVSMMDTAGRRLAAPRGRMRR